MTQINMDEKKTYQELAEEYVDSWFETPSIYNSSACR